MRYIRWILLFLILFIVSGGVLALQLFKHDMNQDILTYLKTDKGYQEHEIYKIYTQIGKAPVVSTTVIFNDEQYNKYFYRKEEGRIFQYSHAPVRTMDGYNAVFKHEEKDVTLIE